MKCVKYIRLAKDVSRPLLRVSDEEAAALVASGDWQYISKSEFKKGQQANG